MEAASHPQAERFLESTESPPPLRVAPEVPAPDDEPAEAGRVRDLRAVLDFPVRLSKELAVADIEELRRSLHEPPETFDPATLHDAADYESLVYAVTREQSLRLRRYRESDRLLEEVAFSQMERPTSRTFRDPETNRRFSISLDEQQKISYISFAEPEITPHEQGKLLRHERYERVTILERDRPVTVWRRCDWMVILDGQGEAVRYWDDGRVPIESHKVDELRDMIARSG